MGPKTPAGPLWEEVCISYAVPALPQCLIHSGCSGSEASALDTAAESQASDRGWGWVASSAVSAAGLVLPARLGPPGKPASRSPPALPGLGRLSPAFCPDPLALPCVTRTRGV